MKIEKQLALKTKNFGILFDMEKVATDIYSFEKLRSNGFAYVDKTAILKEMADMSYGSQFFIARPRRFGKSLAVSTLKALFEGRCYTEVLYITLVNEYLSDLLLYVRAGNIYRGVLCRTRVTDSRKHICDSISDLHFLLPP